MLSIDEIEPGFNPDTNNAVSDYAATETAQIERKIVLLVDDEPMIAEFLKEVLEPNGWETITAVEPVDAMSQWNKAVPKPSVVICDLNLEKADDGLALAKKIFAAAPATKIIISSGSMSEQIALPQEFHYLGKPFRIKQLLDLFSNVE